MLFVLSILSVILASTVEIASAGCGITQWNTAQYNFQQQCKTQYGGIADGARCFFVTPAGSESVWTDAFKSCQSRNNSKLAVILTTSELSTLTQLNNLNGVGIGTLIYTAGMRTGTNDDPYYTLGCSYARDKTSYYSDANTTSLSVSGTFMRNRQCNKDDTGGDGQCIFVSFAVGKFDDYPCTAKLRALCQITSPVQAYRRVERVCLTETPLAVVQTNGGPEGCMDECRVNDYCRSFNIKNGVTCELFTEWINDHPSMTFQPKRCATDCVHYTYIPTIY